MVCPSQQRVPRARLVREAAASGQACYRHVPGGPELPLGPVSESQVAGLAGTNGSENAGIQKTACLAIFLTEPVLRHIHIGAYVQENKYVFRSIDT